MNRIVLVLALALITPLLPRTHAAPAVAPSRTRIFQNKYLRIRLAPRWTVAPPHAQSPRTARDCCTVTFTHGKFILEINPVFDHASGAIGGRMDEVLKTQPSILAFTGGEGDAMQLADLCMGSRQQRVSRTLTLHSLYLDPAKMKTNCNPPFPAVPVWLASYNSGKGPLSDYSIALTYNSTDLNALPRLDSPELQTALRDVSRMLLTLHFKSPSP